MSEAPESLDAIEALKRQLLESEARLAERNRALESAEARVIAQKLELEKLRFQLACLRRMKFGRSSEALDLQLSQMQLTLEDLEATLASKPESIRPAPKQPAAQPVRRALPDHLPREQIVHHAPCSCPACGGELRALGEDVSEILERVPASFRVIRHVRPKLSCTRCQKIVQAPAPSRPIAKGLFGPGFLAHILVSKYADHLPLYRKRTVLAALKSRR